MLVGRVGECTRIDGLLDDARAGRGGTLVLRGEAGVGKTALVAYALEQAADMAVVRTSGVESEAELAFAGLHELCRPLLGCLEALPPPQAAALRSALALERAYPVDRLTIVAATLALLAAGAEERPLLVVADDAHWLDEGSCSALLFAARRVGSDPVAMLFAAREGDERAFAAPGLEELVVRGLDRDSALVLLAEAAPRCEESTARHLVEVTAGNPLALLELPRSLSEEQLRGAEPIEEPLRLGPSLERTFSRRAAVLGEAARRALLVGAADGSGDLAAIGLALERLEVDRELLVRAEDDGLVRVEAGRLAFRHPLVRAAVYHSAAPSERRAAHRALADALAGRDESRRTWHLADAAVGPNEETALALSDLGTRSRDRGAYTEAASAFERAAGLSGEADLRLRRLAAAADAAWLAGRSEHARALAVQGLAAGAEGQARVDLLALRARIDLFGGDQEQAFATFAEAAALAEPQDPARAAALYAEAISAGIQTANGSLADAVTALERLRRPGDPFLEFVICQALGVAASVAGDARSVGWIRRAVAALDDGALALDSALHLFWAGRTRFMLGQNDEASALARRAAERARQDGALGLLPQALRLLASADFDRGRWRNAYAAAGEAAALSRELGQRSTLCACLGLLAEIDAARGNEADCRAAAAEAVELAHELGLGYYRGRAERAIGQLEIALGRLAVGIRELEAAEARLARAGNREANVTPLWDLVEAHARLGDHDRAGAALAAAEPLAAHEGEVAVLERCRGIVAADDSFELHFDRALDLHGLHEFPFERARTELCYGERLRRAGQRRRARELLRRALAMFHELGADAWVDRASTELRASGERLRARDSARRDFLTPREMQIALEVAAGASNREVAAALFLTPKTVEFHLTRIYRKLGVHSRGELIRLYAQNAGQSSV
jgi:DNA-binding CsgD family transcriptional regulator